MRLMQVNQQLMNTLQIFAAAYVMYEHGLRLGREAPGPKSLQKQVLRLIIRLYTLTVSAANLALNRNCIKFTFVYWSGLSQRVQGLSSAVSSTEMDRFICRLEKSGVSIFLLLWRCSSTHVHISTFAFNEETKHGPDGLRKKPQQETGKSSGVMQWRQGASIPV